MISMVPDTADAKTKTLSLAADRGAGPVVMDLSSELRRPRMLVVKVTASLKARLAGKFWVSCRRGYRQFKRKEFAVNGPGTYRAGPTMRGARACLVGSLVSYRNKRKSGALKVKVYGMSRAKRGSGRPVAPPPTPGTCTPNSFVTAYNALGNAVSNLESNLGNSTWQSEIQNTVLPQSQNLLENGFNGQTLFGVSAPTAVASLEAIHAATRNAEATVYPGGDMEDTLFAVLMIERAMYKAGDLWGFGPGSLPGDPQQQVTPQFADAFNRMLHVLRNELFLLEALQKDYGDGWNSQAQGYSDLLAKMLTEVIEPVAEVGFAGQSLLGIDAGAVFTGFYGINDNLRGAAGTGSVDQAVPLIEAAESAWQKLSAAVPACT
jgi:hypothetical protein